MTHGTLQPVSFINVTFGTHWAIAFSMDERSIAPYLSMKGLSAREIHQELVETLGAEAVEYCTLTYDLPKAKLAGQSEEAPVETELMRIDRLEAIIVKVLAGNPFYLMSKLQQLACLFRSTVHRHLTESHGCNLRYLRLVSHRLSDDQREIRSTCLERFCQCLKQRTLAASMIS
jgi:hypothetical protein